MKLYPPYVEGTIPAFYEDSKGTVTLTVPFSMNRAVSVNEVRGFQAKVKTVQSNTYLLTLRTTDNTAYDMEDDYVVEFHLSKDQADELCVGEYYKVQLAYIDTDGFVGYYSTVGVTKFTTKPLVRIENLTQHTTNAHDYIYTGLYRQYAADENGYNIKDTTEKEYSYQFRITDKEGNVIDDTGIIIHNNEKDVETYESVDEYSYYSDIPENIVYYIQYIVYTNNNMTVKSPKYKIVQKKSVPPEIDATIEAVMNNDNGYIDVHLIGNLDDFGMEKATTGAFLITRACSEDHFTRWVEVFRFTLHGQQPSFKLLRDFTIEQGKEYIYSLQQYNDYGLYSSRMLSNTVMCDFEDIFIFDGERQLKIKYNPKVSSFKTNILETKIDTIGTKFPFVFRNGKVEYKEFPIGGLISYWSDDENLFISDDELGLTEGYANVKRPGTLRKDITSNDEEYFWQFTHPDITGSQLREMYKKQEAIEALMQNAKPRTTQLVDYNVSAERTFKLAVLDWLNDGKIKLFRSPSEGNYLIRVMNVSLTPEDRLSRMIHSFQATAYEMDQYSYENLVKYGIIQVQHPDLTQLRWEGLEMVTDTYPADNRYTNIGDLWYLQGDILTTHNAARTVRFDGLVPGSVVYVRIKGEDMQTINIGVTGSYQVDTGMEIDIIRLPENAQYQGTITYSYYNDAQNVFNTIQYVDVVDYLGQQYLGKTSNIIDSINNVKFTLLKFFYLHFDKRYTESYSTIQPLLETINDSNATAEDRAEAKRLINELPLYLEQAESIKIYSNTVYGLEKVDNAVVLRDLVVSPSDPTTKIVSNKYFYLQGGVLYQGGTYSYENPKTYYIKKPLNIYHDYSKKDVNGNIIDTWYVDQDTYNRISIAYPTINLSHIELVSYELNIDGHVLDLNEVEKFDIDENILFDSIIINNGVSLECGYQLQEITYTVESTREVAKVITNINGNWVNIQDTYNTYRHYLSADYFYELREGEITDELYYTNVYNARQEMPVVYPTYMQLVTEQKIIWEENEHYGY